MKTILQVPMDKKLKVSAEQAAHNQGFSSLQEVVRVFLAQLADNRVSVTIQESVPLSPKNEKRYLKMEEDLKKGKNWSSANDLDDFLTQLKSEH